MKLNNYDAIARNYDMLSRMVFFKSQVKAQIAQIKFIPSRSNILIVGGGTGWILEEISKVCGEGLKITYVEISEKMIRLASKRSAKGNILEFVNLPIEDFIDDCRYDVVITAFLFDNFKEERIQQVFSKLNHMLKPSGLWLFSDFDNPENGGSKWQEWLLSTMYYFFGKIAHVEATTLIPMQPYFIAKNYKPLDIQTYYQGFIKAIVYKKSA
ncbi:class I SAM-dependent methyltransferase [Pedobacter duraquae]|uniref:Ubiquinone/menaquinone biosynthesis C-methylase UbiE n=1 Tax=Pedobacter duraquae TaxID=425511 RepID=A0A4R6ILS2_9SPHI|nr:class I SAM-dependent methyltransferase [Pedobacter duraquae]TDO23047.1 ubiquinone/menaquinone biosynthesis C-methylase UbiE [Pedobacter duraquae]